MKVDGGSALTNAEGKFLVAEAREIADHFVRLVKDSYARVGTGAAIDNDLRIDLSEWKKIAASVNAGASISNAEARTLLNVVGQVTRRRDEIKARVDGLLRENVTRTLATDTQPVQVIESVILNKSPF